jgi:hypothetical protein
MFPRHKNIYNEPSLLPTRPNILLVGMPKSSNIEHAIFTDSDVAPIINLLGECPETSRVFRQHFDLGTCWYDAFFMMIFECFEFKPFLKELLFIAFDTFIKHGINDLTYIDVKDKSPEQIEKEQKEENELSEKFKFKSSKVKTTIENKELKKNLLTDTFMTVFEKECKNNNSKRCVNEPQFPHIRTGFEILSHTLQKYMLLGFLFYKQNIQNKTVVGRRKSINFQSFEYLHACLRLSGGMFQGIGIFEDQNQSFVSTMKRVLEIITKNRLTFEDFKTKVNNPLGYYFTVRGHYLRENGSQQNYAGHIISFFKCSTWCFYNNEYGVVPLSKEHSARIDEFGIKDYSIKSDVATNLTTHTVTLNDDSIFEFTTEVVLNDKGEMVLYNMTLWHDYKVNLILCRMEQTNANKGGKRKNRKTKKRKSHR